MKRRKVTACAMAALMAMGLVGTVMPVYAKSNLKNVDDVVEIKMAVWTSGAADIYNKAAEGFNQTHDNIKLYKYVLSREEKIYESCYSGRRFWHKDQ